MKHLIVAIWLTIILAGCKKADSAIQAVQTPCIESLEIIDTQDVGPQYLEYKFTVVDSLKKYIESNFESFDVEIQINDSTSFKSIPSVGELSYLLDEQLLRFRYPYPPPLYSENTGMNSQTLQTNEQNTLKLLKASTLVLKDKKTKAMWTMSSCRK